MAKDKGSADFVSGALASRLLQARVSVDALTDLAFVRRHEKSLSPTVDSSDPNPQLKNAGGKITTVSPRPASI